jgi:anti-anti-sigma factor
MPLSLDQQMAGEVVRIEVRGEIDLATRPALVAAIEAAYETPGTRSLVVDLAGVTFMDCYGMSALIHGRALADKRSWGYEVCNATGLPRVVMRMAGLLDYLSGNADDPLAKPGDSSKLM